MNKLISYTIVVTGILYSCHSDRSDVTVAYGDIAIQVRHVTTNEIIEGEKARNLITSKDMDARRQVLEDEVHLSLRVISAKAFTTEQKHYLKHAIEQDLILRHNGICLKRSLFINESVMPGENIVQYFLAFHNEFRLSKAMELMIDAEELGINKQSVSIPIQSKT